VHLTVNDRRLAGSGVIVKQDLVSTCRHLFTDIENLNSCEVKIHLHNEHGPINRQITGRVVEVPGNFDHILIRASEDLCEQEDVPSLADPIDLKFLDDYIILVSSSLILYSVEQNLL
jgi:hypothetical protein